jgi:probable phosphoglycerate mutase
MTNRYLYLIRHGEADYQRGGLTDTGRRQAGLTGQRLRDVPFDTVHHSPVSRAAETAALVAAHLPGVPIDVSDLVGDYIPPVPDRAALPPEFARFLDQFTEAELAEGARLADAAVTRYAGTATGDGDRRELIVTHNFQVAWFVRHALDAPPWRWMTLNQGNCGLTVILYRPDRPASLLLHNDTSHLGDPLP